MARITVEDCLDKTSNRFELVMLGAKRAQQLLKGAKPLIESDNREVVIALREIAVGKAGDFQNLTCQSNLSGAVLLMPASST